MSRVAKPLTQGAPRFKQNAGATHPTDLDAPLTQIFADLASLLLRNGYGFSRLNALSKEAFVEAARDLEEALGSRPSIARIATSTGLTRVEVSRILRRESRRFSTKAIQPNRASRVAQGWTADKAFSFMNSPKELPFSGGKTSFAQLVKKYSGDIPARAMLKEMKRLAMVRHTEQDTVVLTRANVPASRRTITALRAIGPWVKFLTATNKRGEAAEHSSNANRLSLHFDSLPQVFAALREIEDRRQTFVESLAQLSTQTTRASSYEIAVSVAVASTKPEKTKKGKKTLGRGGLETHTRI